MKTRTRCIVRLSVLLAGVLVLETTRPTVVRAAETKKCGLSCEVLGTPQCPGKGVCSTDPCLTEDGHWYPYTISCGLET